MVTTWLWLSVDFALCLVASHSWTFIRWLCYKYFSTVGVCCCIWDVFIGKVPSRGQCRCSKVILIFAQLSSTCTVTIRLLFILRWWRCFPKPSQSAQLTCGQKTLGWFFLIRQEAQEWTHFCLLSIIYVVFTLFFLSDDDDATWSLSHVYFSNWLLWGLKGKYWTNLCLPLRIFLQVRLYHFNLLFL